MCSKRRVDRGLRRELDDAIGRVGLFTRVYDEVLQDVPFQSRQRILRDTGGQNDRPARVSNERTHTGAVDCLIA